MGLYVNVIVKASIILHNLDTVNKSVKNKKIALRLISLTLSSNKFIFFYKTAPTTINAKPIKVETSSRPYLCSPKMVIPPKVEMITLN